MFYRTDLALERRDIYNKANNLENDIDGIECEEEKQGEKIIISRVKIKNREGEQALGKPIGTYITLDIKDIKYMEDNELKGISNSISKELNKVLESYLNKEDSVLVIGLGNEYVTPDSLGPKVASKVEVTRHVIKYCPQFVKEGTREISAVSPGVLGVTGIETLEIVKGIVENVKPKLLIAIDSLCSKDLNRISSSVQIADTGIVPGGGIGNKREEISKASLGIPVIAIGVPTVTAFPNDNDFIVTPKEIDELIKSMSEIISESINMSL